MVLWMLSKIGKSTFLDYLLQWMRGQKMATYRFSSTHHRRNFSIFILFVCKAHKHTSHTSCLPCDVICQENWKILTGLVLKMSQETQKTNLTYAENTSGVSLSLHINCNRYAYTSTIKNWNLVVVIFFLILFLASKDVCYTYHNFYNTLLNKSIPLIFTSGKATLGISERIELLIIIVQKPSSDTPQNIKHNNREGNVT